MGTTIQATTIPKARINEKSTIKLNVKPMLGITINAINMDNGTDTVVIGDV